LEPIRVDVLPSFKPELTEKRRIEP